MIANSSKAGLPPTTPRGSPRNNPQSNSGGDPSVNLFHNNIPQITPALTFPLDFRQPTQPTVAERIKAIADKLSENIDQDNNSINTEPNNSDSAVNNLIDTPQKAFNYLLFKYGVIADTATNQEFNIALITLLECVRNNSGKDALQYSNFLTGACPQDMKKTTIKCIAIFNKNKAWPPINNAVILKKIGLLIDRDPKLPSILRELSQSDESRERFERRMLQVTVDKTRGVKSSYNLDNNIIGGTTTNITLKGGTTNTPLHIIKDNKIKGILDTFSSYVRKVNAWSQFNYLKQSFGDRSLSVAKLFIRDRNRQYFPSFTIVNKDGVTDQYSGTLNSTVGFYNRNSDGTNCKDAIDGWEHPVEKSVLKAFWWQGTESVTQFLLADHGLKNNDVMTIMSSSRTTSCTVNFQTNRVTIITHMVMADPAKSENSLLPLELELTFKFKLSRIAENKKNEIIDNSQIEEGNKDNAIHEALISLKPQELIDFSKTRLNMTQKNVEDIQPE